MADGFIAGQRKALFILFLIIFDHRTHAQVTDPVVGSRRPSDNKFLSRDSLTLEKVVFGQDASKLFVKNDTKKGYVRADPNQCGLDVDLAWTAEVESSIYATPMIADLHRDGNKEVVITTFAKNIEVLSGVDGEHMPGWPYGLTDATFHASPLLYDIDDNGIMETLVITANGEIVFFDEHGIPLVEYSMKLPRLQVRKDWFVDYKEDHEHGRDPDLEHQSSHRHGEDPVPYTGAAPPHNDQHTLDVDHSGTEPGSETYHTGPPPAAPPDLSSPILAGQDGVNHPPPVIASDEKYHAPPPPAPELIVQLTPIPPPPPQQEHTTPPPPPPPQQDYTTPPPPAPASHEQVTPPPGPAPIQETPPIPAPPPVQQETPPPPPDHHMPDGTGPTHAETPPEGYHPPNPDAAPVGRRRRLMSLDEDEDGVRDVGVSSDVGQKTMSDGVGKGSSDRLEEAEGKIAAQKMMDYSRKEGEERGEGRNDKDDLQKGDSRAKQQEVMRKRALEAMEKRRKVGEEKKVGEEDSSAQKGTGAVKHGALKRSDAFRQKVEEEEEEEEGATGTSPAEGKDVTERSGFFFKRKVEQAMRNARDALKASGGENAKEGQEPKKDSTTTNKERGDSVGDADGKERVEEGMVKMRRRSLKQAPVDAEGVEGGPAEEVPANDGSAPPAGEEGGGDDFNWNEWGDGSWDDSGAAYEDDPTLSDMHNDDSEGAPDWGNDQPPDWGAPPDWGSSDTWSDAYDEEGMPIPPPEEAKFEEEMNWSPPPEDATAEESWWGGGGGGGEDQPPGGPDPAMDQGMPPYGDESSYKPPEDIYDDMNWDKNVDEWSPEAESSWNAFEPGTDDTAAGEDDQPWSHIWDDAPKWEDPWDVSEGKLKEGNVFVDPHVLCTPAIADIDGDGNLDLVVAVSYYFDREYYNDPAHAKEIPEGIQMNKYVAGAVVVMDLALRHLKWMEHLDLTTDETQYRAYMYSSPSVADVDRDGHMEIAVGTSAGWLYLLDHTGKVKPNFPIEMAEIQGQVTLADLNGDADLELIAVDSRGNLAVFLCNGSELWDRRLYGLAAQPASVGDINGDGVLDIVVGTDAGVLWALDGATGKDVKGFPLKTDDRILSAALLVKLGPNSANYGGQGRNSSQPGLHIVIPSFDGYLYIVDGYTTCVHKVDIGEQAYSMVLADDLRGTGKLNLVLSTMNGMVYSFSTNTPYHPLKAHPAQGYGRNGMVASEDYMGIFVHGSSRGPKDILGRRYTVYFDIVDKRPANTRKDAAYTVKVNIAGRKVLGQAQFSKPGSHQMIIDCPPERLQALVTIEMTNEQGLVFYDSFPLSFNLHFYRTLKWILVLPFVAMVGVLLLVKDLKQPLLMPR